MMTFVLESGEIRQPLHRSGFDPATAAAACVSAAQHPAVTIPSAPVSSASRLPTPSISSSIERRPREASSMARFTSGESAIR